MSGENIDHTDAEGLVDEWRVEEGGTSEAEAPGGNPAEVRSDASLRCARVSADLASWRTELTGRLERFEARLKSASAPDS